MTVTRPAGTVKGGELSVGERRLAARRTVQRRRRWLRRGAVVGVVLLVVGAVWAVGWSPWLAVQRIQVTGTQRLSPDEVRSTLTDTRGVPLARVDVRELERRVEALPQVESATVTRDWPRGLQVVVHERVAVATARDSGVLRLVDADGVLFADADPGEDLPAVHVDLSYDDPGRLDAALTVLAALPPKVAAVLESLEVPTQADVRLRLADGAEVSWGDASRSDFKADVLAALRKTAPEALRYDVSAPDAPSIVPGPNAG